MGCLGALLSRRASVDVLTHHPMTSVQIYRDRNSICPRLRGYPYYFVLLPSCLLLI